MLNVFLFLVAYLTFALAHTGLTSQPRPAALNFRRSNKRIEILARLRAHRAGNFNHRRADTGGASPPPVPKCGSVPILTPFYIAAFNAEEQFVKDGTTLGDGGATDNTGSDETFAQFNCGQTAYEFDALCHLTIASSGNICTLFSSIPRVKAHCWFSRRGHRLGIPHFLHLL